jgi:hypothetical protein
MRRSHVSSSYPTPVQKFLDSADVHKLHHFIHAEGQSERPLDGVHERNMLQ